MLEGLLETVDAHEELFDPDQIICAVGDELKEYPVLVTGLVQAALPRNGSLQIVEHFHPGDSFAEAVPTSIKRSPVQITALKTCRIIMIPAKSLVQANDPLIARLSFNLMGEMSKKIGGLSRKLQLLGEPKLRKRLLMYLADLPVDDDGWITLPFKYRELAEYLSVTKASFSRELHRMQDDGVIVADRTARRILVLKPLGSEEGDSGD